MFSFLRRDLPAVGRVFYPGALPPTAESLNELSAPVTVSRTEPARHQVWAVNATHPDWGSAEIAAERPQPPLLEILIAHSLALSDDEKARALTGESAISVEVTGQKDNVLRDRKRLLFWLRTLMRPDGVLAFDTESTLPWSQTMLDDELAHDADLDIEALYVLHAVRDDADGTRTTWLHTHGLEGLGAFDVDVLRPSREFVGLCADPVRALAFAALEGAISSSTDSFMLTSPGGEIRLVPADRFQAEAAPEHRELRTDDAAHSGRRAVVCDPVGGLFSLWRKRPTPSRFLSTVVEPAGVMPFSTPATELMADRARRTLQVFDSLRNEFASLKLPCVVKLGYEVAGGGPTDREHLWFEVHGVSGGKIDATLANTPHRVPSLQAGQRGEHDVERLTDWLILSPEGQMTPRNLSAARRLRVTRERWQQVIDGGRA
ncbi:MAG TPA: DUF4026 domain-containing protein [Vicinamibacterales bacterium]|nr:DUF4026 domain-containing protein [Vicinamibacterales bacterium]